MSQVPTERPQTPLPVAATRRLSVLVTAGAVAWMIYDYPEVDEGGRENALTGIKRASRSMYARFLSVSDADRAAVRRAQAAAAPPPPKD